MLGNSNSQFQDNFNGGSSRKRGYLIGIACVVGIGLALFGLNYYHLSGCPATDPDEIEGYINAVNKRLLQAELQTARNGVVMEKLLNALQTKITKLEEKEVEIITKESQEEAIRIALILVSQPAPPMPDFELDVENSASSSGKYDDFLFYNSSYSSSSNREGFDDRARVENFGSGGYDDFKEKKFTDGYKEFTDDDKTRGGGDNINVLTDAEAIKSCTEWKDQYGVIAGISWGSLPYDLQQKWLQMSCDYHLQDENSHV